MTGEALGTLLQAAAEQAERSAPAPDPLAAVAAARRHRAQRRGHLVALAFVGSVVVLQALPADALADPAPAGRAVAAAEPTPLVVARD